MNLIQLLIWIACKSQKRNVFKFVERILRITPNMHKMLNCTEKHKIPSEQIMWKYVNQSSMTEVNYAHHSSKVSYSHKNSTDDGIVWSDTISLIKSCHKCLHKQTIMMRKEKKEPKGWATKNITKLNNN